MFKNVLPSTKTNERKKFPIVSNMIQIKDSQLILINSAMINLEYTSCLQLLGTIDLAFNKLFLQPKKCIENMMN